MKNKVSPSFILVSLYFTFHSKESFLTCYQIYSFEKRNKIIFQNPSFTFFVFA